MTKLNLKDLEGKWYIHYTNFPMWLKGDKTQPTFNYSLAMMNGKVILLDTVEYVQNTKIKTIKGIDYPVDDSNKKFMWRGKGILTLFKSKWEIVFISDQMQWAIIQFEKTLFTPAGFDLISRREVLRNGEMEEAERIMKQLNIVGLKYLIPVSGYTFEE